MPQQSCLKEIKGSIWDETRERSFVIQGPRSQNWWCCLGALPLLREAGHGSVHGGGQSECACRVDGSPQMLKLILHVRCTYTNFPFSILDNFFSLTGRPRFSWPLIVSAYSSVILCLVTFSALLPQQYLHRDKPQSQLQLSEKEGMTFTYDPSTQR